MSKVYLITGASSGIGAAAARLLLAQGHIVYGAARRTERLQQLIEAGLHPLRMDVSKDEAMVAGIDQILTTHGRIDGLVNNAGYGEYGALEDTPIADARYQFEVNVFGLARLIQLVLPHMRAQRSGRIVNVSSIGGRIGEPHGAWYHATKFAVEGLSDSLRMELKPFDIDVVVIQPGAIRTEWNGIARQKLLETSGDTAYGPVVHQHVKMLEEADSQAAPPEVVGKAIATALTAPRPKTRYVVGSGAKPILFMRKMLTDRWFDKLMLGFIGRQ